MNYQLAIRTSSLATPEQLAMATGPTALVVATALVALGQRAIAADPAALVVPMVHWASPAAPAVVMMLATDHAVVRIVVPAAVLEELAVSAGADHLAKPKQYP